ncbi:Crp/Fnr family transcriptional regulator [Candidatus Magnetominusculus xianensis]|uniref:Crp/Fnr family transcriptional regulator n=1 Tax=Candidatus Magnetominusculus xianensis TaxID=1748249 RepID=A0ABR5SFM5_9BACT|nr:Crp/Fnr family transcriptional regulator [Candidatus Magnetominusculus xianensis]KWT86086.1 Crp/Fnr family transcriptional regulator [Candidatus Magnetominusculus xianensis]MBF0404414.1 Crp/Fnr family transcriptional regulator [Nitrospirota bacterium]
MRLSGQHKRNKLISVRVNTEEYDLIRQNADELDIASYIRAAALEKPAPAVVPWEIDIHVESTHEIKSLRSVELLAGLSDYTLATVYNKLKIKRYNKNDLVFLLEDPNSYVYFILSGSVKVTQLSEEGKEIIIAIHRAGSFFGEMSLIDGKPVSANVYCAERSVVGLMSGQDFFSLLYDNREVLQNLLKIFCQRVRSSNDKIEILNSNNAAQRIKILFILLSKKYGTETTNGIVLNTRLTHQDIANMTGMVRETVTRTINKWIKNGDISLSGGKFIQLNNSFFEDYPNM